MIKTMIVAVALIAILALMVATNPTPDDYSDYLRQDFAKEANKKGEVPGALAGIVGGVAGSLLSGAAERHNYLFFSTYTIGSNSDQRVTLGILGNFVVLEDGE
jgi:hypothetical protein